MSESICTEHMLCKCWMLLFQYPMLLILIGCVYVCVCMDVCMYQGNLLSNTCGRRTMWKHGAEMQNQLGCSLPWQLPADPALLPFAVPRYAPCT